MTTATQHDDPRANEDRQDRRDGRAGWDDVGRAAEHFARRIARDAGRFAERIEEHAGEFARDVSRDWRRARRHAWHGCRQATPAGAPEVRRVFDDIRTVLADVLDGFDELIDQVFPEPERGGTSSRPEWVQVVVNRAATCAACQASIAAGDEAYAHRGEQGTEFRCAPCGGAPADPIA